MAKSCSHNTTRPPINDDFNWRDTNLWKQSATNTAWCLLGCSIGDLGTILGFQLLAPDTATLTVMTLAIMNGILTSILLETFILSRQMAVKAAFKTAVGMSLVSMLAMEIAMNLVDYLLVGEARLVWWAVPFMLLAGFITPWPYNYWRLKKHGKSCH